MISHTTATHNKERREKNRTIMAQALLPTHYTVHGTQNKIYIIFWMKL